MTENGENWKKVEIILFLLNIYHEPLRTLASNVNYLTILIISALGNELKLTNNPSLYHVILFKYVRVVRGK